MVQVLECSVRYLCRRHVLIFDVNGVGISHTSALHQCVRLVLLCMGNDLPLCLDFITSMFVLFLLPISAGLVSASLRFRLGIKPFFNCETEG
uniref:Uncharacterized protein n=1 Tax=Hyaloperonospora arabidopsidis (strain Emoy2) TaxID=559515 RepID=M4BUR2_HYAAE